MKIVANWTLPNLTLDQWRLVVQGVGPIVALLGAFLAIWFARSLEDKKSKLKLKEIIHANTEKRRLEVLEGISKLTGKVAFRMWFVGNVIDTINKPVKQREGESREDWLRRRFRVRAKALNEVHLELHELVDAGSIYLTPELEAKVEALRNKTNDVIDTYVNEMLTSSTVGAEVFQTFKDGYEEVKKDRKEIVQLIRTLISY